MMNKKLKKTSSQNLPSTQELSEILKKIGNPYTKQTRGAKKMSIKDKLPFVMRSEYEQLEIRIGTQRQSITAGIKKINRLNGEVERLGKLIEGYRNIGTPAALFCGVAIGFVFGLLF